MCIMAVKSILTLILKIMTTKKKNHLFMATSHIYAFNKVSGVHKLLDVPTRVKEI